MDSWGWTWIDGEDDEAGNAWIQIGPLEDDGHGNVVQSDEVATIMCRNIEQVRAEHPERIVQKEWEARLIVNALNLREDVLNRLAEGFTFPESTREIAEEVEEFHWGYDLGGEA